MNNQTKKDVELYINNQTKSQIYHREFAFMTHLPMEQLTAPHISFNVSVSFMFKK